MVTSGRMWKVLLLSSLLIPMIPLLGQNEKQIDKYSIAYGDWGVPTPFHHRRGPSYVLTSFIWDTLIWKDDKGFVPWLADNWTSSKDGLTWLIHLRSGVYWHDGSPLTAKDVAFTFNYLKKYPFPFGAADVSIYLKSAKALNSSTVEIDLKEPYSDFVGVFLGEVLIIPEHIWGNVTDPLKYVDKKAFIGSGPYKLVEYKKGEYYLLEANEKYFMGVPIAKKLYLKAVGGPMGGDASLALKSGEVDAASFYGSDVDVVSTFKGSSSYKILEGHSYWVLELIFNCKRYPFNLREFRESIAYAINRSEIVEKVLHGGGEVASLGITHPDSPWYNPNLPRYEYNKSKAELMLDNMGFKDRDGDGIRESPNGTKLSFVVLSVKKYAREAELIKQQLKDIGIYLTIKMMDYKPMDNLLDKGDFSMAITGHGGISYFWPGIKSKVDWPAHTYSNATFQELYDEFYITVDREKRKMLANKMQLIIAQDLPVIALYHPKTYCIYTSSKPVNWFWTPRGIAHGIPIWWNKISLLRGATGEHVTEEKKPSSFIPSALVIAVLIIAVVIVYMLSKRRG